MSEVEALKAALRVLFEGVRKVRRFMPDPAQPTRVTLDLAYREAERHLEQSGVSREGLTT